MQLTIHLQDAILNSLTSAGSDDELVDFAECTDVAERVCKEALLTLQHYYRRKLEASMRSGSQINEAGVPGLEVVPFER